jgi:hypothetical protein
MFSDTYTATPVYSTAFYCADHGNKSLHGPYSRYGDALNAKAQGEVIVSKGFAGLLTLSGYALNAPKQEAA